MTAMAADPRKIALIGFMGAGKTTVGRLLAARLGAEFHDLDDLVATTARLSVAEIFSRHGEAHFRSLEAMELHGWLERTSTKLRVLAVGGGAVESAEVRGMLEDGVTVIYLEAPLDVMLCRCRAQAVTRPLLSQAEERFARRESFYRALGQPVRTEDRTPAQVAADICTLIEVSV